MDRFRLLLTFCGKGKLQKSFFSTNYGTPSVIHAIRIDRNDHSRIYQIEGFEEAFPSVTTVLQVISKPFLSEWEKKVSLNRFSELLSSQSWKVSSPTGLELSQEGSTRLETKDCDNLENSQRNHLVDMVRVSLEQPSFQLQQSSTFGTRAHLALNKLILSEQKEELYSPALSIQLKEDKEEVFRTAESSSNLTTETKDMEDFRDANRIVNNEEKNSAEENIGPVVAGFEAWKEMHRSEISIIRGDTIVFSRQWKYAGAVDAIGRGRNGELIVVDWKTSNAIRNEYALQLSAYAKALEEMQGEPVSEGWIVRFGKKGVEFETCKIKNLDECFDGFKSALTLWNLMQQKLFMQHSFVSDKVEEKIGNSIESPLKEKQEEHKQNDQHQERDNEGKREFKYCQRTSLDSAGANSISVNSENPKENDTRYHSSTSVFGHSLVLDESSNGTPHAPSHSIKNRTYGDKVVAAMVTSYTINSNEEEQER